MDPFYKGYEKSAFFYIYFMCFCVTSQYIMPFSQCFLL